MKPGYSSAAALLLAGIATFASAQSPQAPSFAERFAEQQAVSSNSLRFQRPAAPKDGDATRMDGRPGQASKAKSSSKDAMASDRMSADAMSHDAKRGAMAHEAMPANAMAHDGMKDAMAHDGMKGQMAKDPAKK